MKKVFGLFLTLFVFVAPSFGQLQWSPCATGVTNNLKAIQMVDEHEGWAVGLGGVILHTVDEGQTWETQYDDDYSTFVNLHFIDNQEGWACSWNDTLLHTTDGGLSWSALSGPASNIDYEDVHFWDSDHGVLATYSWSTFGIDMWYTEDGGVTWEPAIFTGSDNIIYNFDFINDTEGWACGNQMIWHTTDGGESWDPQPTGAIGAHKAVDFVDELHGWVAVDSSEVVYSTMGGDDASWPYHTITGTYFLTDLKMVNTVLGYATALNGKILGTLDGVSWGEIPFTSPQSMNGLHVETWTSVWVCGNNGEIWRGQLSPNDAEIISHSLPDSVCREDIITVEVEVANSGPSFLDEFSIEAFFNGTSIGTYDFDTGLGVDESTIIDFGEHFMSEEGTFTFEMVGDTTTWNNIKDHVVKLVTEPPHGTNGDMVVCPRQEVELTAFGGDSYTWHAIGPDGEDISENPATGVFYQEGTVYVTVHQEFCWYVDSLEITFEECDVTNAFTPNSDGKNDSFLVQGLADNVSNIFKVYNRWGQVLATISDYDNEINVWNGGYNNSPDILPSGTYFYTVQYPSDTNMNFSGWVQLVR